MYIRRLSDQWLGTGRNDKQAIIDLYSKMTADDRRLRFAHPVNVDYAIEYAKQLDLTSTSSDVFFGACTALGILVAVIEIISTAPDSVELALYVDPDYRGQHIGSELFEQAMLWANNRGIKKFYSMCLSDNQSMVKIAKKYGMKLSSSYGDTEAKKDLTGPTMFTISDELRGRYYNMMNMMIDYRLYQYDKFWKVFYGK